MHYVKDKRVAVVGLGRSGAAAARLLSVHGAQVTVLDDKAPEKLADRLARLQGLPRVRFAPGGVQAKSLVEADLVVVSPGVPSGHPALQAAREAGVPVIGEMELAFGYCPAPVAAITGTNGKTTTTALTAAMLQAGGVKAVACGNIGRAFADAVFELGAGDWAVLEVSSFQLEGVREFRPAVASILNVTPDHLDRHGDMQAYARTKARIFQDQGAQDALLLNVNDKYTPLYEGLAKGRLFFFGEGPERKGRPGCYLVGGSIELMGRRLLKASEIPLPGPHNRENACAAALMASLCGVEDPAIAKALAEFQGVEHRLEPAGEVEGIRFVNDSKGTNVDSVLKALQSFPKPIVLMLGGRDKEGDFTRLLPEVENRVTRVVAFGECRSKIARQLGKAVTVVEADSLEEAVRGAFAASHKGGAVLFSPGCASFDMFENYEDRGRKFKAVVEGLRRQKAEVQTGREH